MYPARSRGVEHAPDGVALQRARATRMRLDVVESSGGNTGLIEFAAYEK